jgi:hypothetical protein
MALGRQERPAVPAVHNIHALLDEPMARALIIIAVRGRKGPCVALGHDQQGVAVVADNGVTAASTKGPFRTFEGALYSSRQLNHAH